MTTRGVRPRDLRASRWSAAGGASAAGAAVLTWLCCLPLGVGAASAGVAAASFGWALRPYLSGLAVLLLGFAFYRAYRRVPCDDGSCTTSTQRRRVRRLLWGLALLTAVLLSFPLWSSRLIYWFL